MTAGEGENSILVDGGGDPGGVVQVMDYDAAQDQLLVLWDPPGSPEPTVEVSEDPDRPGASQVLLDGRVVAIVHGATELTPGDIALLDRGDAARLGLDV